MKDAKYISLSPLNYIMHFRITIMLLILSFSIFYFLKNPDTKEIIFSSVFIISAIISFFWLLKLLKYKTFVTNLSLKNNEEILLETLTNLNWEITAKIDERTYRIYANNKKFFSQTDYLTIIVFEGHLRVNSLYSGYGGQSRTTNAYLTKFIKTFRKLSSEK